MARSAFQRRGNLIFCLMFLFSSPLSWSMGPQEDALLSVKSSLVGKPAPDAVLSRTDGTSGKVVDSRQGKKAILVFWATWCPHCYEDFTAIRDAIQPAEKKGIKIILVDLGETLDKVKSYFQGRQMNLVSFVDPDSYMQDLYRIVGVPTIVFIDEKGIVRRVTHVFPSNYPDFFKT